MLRNYIKIAFRNILRHKGFSFINIFGLALGMASSILILQYVFYELSYDNFHKEDGNIFRVTSELYKNDQLTHPKAIVGHGLGPALKADYPEVTEFARMTWGGNLITYVKGADLNPKTITFRLKGFEKADSVFVAGSFNNWNKEEYLMKRENGEWQASVSVRPGSYEYKFFSDTLELLDPLADTVVSYGNMNSALKIDAPNEKKYANKKFKEITIKEESTYYSEAALFSILSCPMVKGDYKALDEPNTAVLSELSASKLFGKEDPLEKIITVNGTERYVVKGVFKDFPKNSHIKFGALFSIKNLLKDNDSPWGVQNFYTYVKLKPGSDVKLLEKKFTEINAKYFPESFEKGNKYKFLLYPVKDIHLFSRADAEPDVKGNYKVIQILVFIVILILTIAYINYINLTTVRSIDRAKEVGVRKVTGATKGQLINQFLFESGMLSLAAVLIAFTIVQVSQPFFNTLTEKPLSLWSMYDWRFWTLIFSAVTIGIILSGIYPAFLISSFQIVASLKGKLKTSSGISLRKGLVVFQFAVSITLIGGTFVVYKQIDYMRKKELGFNASQVLAITAPRIVASGYDSKLNKFRNEIKSLNGISSFSSSSTIPTRGYSWGNSSVRRATEPVDKTNRCMMFWVDDEFLKVYGIKLLAGRSFSKELKTDDESMIINESTLKTLGFKNPEEAIDQKVIIQDQAYSVVGVIKDYHHSSLKENFAPYILLYSEVNGGFLSMKIDAQQVKGTLSQISEIYDRNFPGNTMEYFFMDEEFNKQYKADEQFGNVFGLFTTLAILISCLGLFGLASFSMIQRRKEIGVRKVLGATVTSLLLLLTRDFVRLIVISSVLAIPLAYYLSHLWLENYPFKVGMSWWLFFIPSLIVLIIAILTISVQTFKSARMNPVKTIRYE